MQFFQQTYGDYCSSLLYVHAFALGGGGTTKIHLLCDRLGNSLNAVLSEGQAADNFYLAPVLDGFEIPVRHGRRNRPKEVVADKAYNGNRVRHYLRNRGIQAMIPEKSLPKGHQRRKKGPHS
jgi:transposase